MTLATVDANKRTRCRSTSTTATESILRNDFQPDSCIALPSDIHYGNRAGIDESKISLSLLADRRAVAAGPEITRSARAGRLSMD